MVPETGLEPAHQMAYAPKAYVYTNFTTRAKFARRLNASVPQLYHKNTGLGSPNRYFYKIKILTFVSVHYNG